MWPENLVQRQFFLKKDFKLNESANNKTTFKIHYEVFCCSQMYLMDFHVKTSNVLSKQL